MHEWNEAQKKTWKVEKLLLNQDLPKPTVESIGGYVIISNYYKYRRYQYRRLTFIYTR